MKLSMWMIANRLLSFEPILNIQEQAPVILKSARLAYAHNCVHVYSKKNGVVYNGEGDTIFIPNISLSHGFELIQSVFDYYQDWSDSIIQHLRNRDYQKVIDLVYQPLLNPIVLFDGNNKVLGITRQYPADSLDEEWAYLSNYGYSSLNALQTLKYNYGTSEFLRPGARSYHISVGSTIQFNGISSCIYCNDIVCGRINLLEKERQLNNGDQQIIEYVSQMLEPSLGQIYYENKLNNSNVFYNLMFHKPYDKSRLLFQLDVHGWSENDIFQIILIKAYEKFPNSGDVNLNILQQLISQHIPGAAIIKQKANLILLVNGPVNDNLNLKKFLHNLAANNPLKIAFSLPCICIENIRYLYKQAIYALNTGCLKQPDEVIYYFYDYAVSFIIEATSLKHSLYACHPDVLYLWNLSETHNDELFTTLKYYLNYDCSISRTSQALFTHRNTVLYRIKKIKELLKDDLEEPYIKNYCRISIQTLELYRSKKMS